MKRPNGSGCVIKLSGKRRRPFAIRVYDGVKINEKGIATPKYKYIGYYEKRTEALADLEKYNSSPVDIAVKKDNKKKRKFSDIYKLWLEDLSRKPKPLSKSTMDCYRAAYKNLEPLHSMIFDKITVKDLEDVALKQSSKSDSTIKNIKILLKGLYKTAMRYGYVDNDLSGLLILYSSNENARPHTIFTKEEIDALWGNKDDFYARILLILIYTGMRVNELLLMESDNVHLKERYMVGGLKTDAGKNRQIPISEKIVPLLDTSGKYLIMLDGCQLKYRYANTMLAEYLTGIGMDHTFHDTRHTTATLLEEAGIPLLHRKLILGHATGDVTDLYTHVSITQLIEDINLI